MQSQHHHIFEPVYLYGKPRNQGVIRQFPADFIVSECLGFEPSGEGEHLYLQVQKQGENTQWLARQLASAFGIRLRDVSFSGLKDRHALTTQWFSLHLPGKTDRDDQVIELPNITVLQRARHHKKLRRGAHKTNEFEIRIRSVAGDRVDIEHRLAALQKGFPNYFGPQRFGTANRNLEKVRQLFAGQLRKVRRETRSLYLSTARAWLFNLVLSGRMSEEGMPNLREGDVLQLAGTNSVFCVTELDSELLKRLEKGDVFLTGPLWGRGPVMTGASMTVLEQGFTAAEPDLKAGLEAAGLTADRRALLSRPRQLSWEWENEATVRIGFHLGQGVYATSLLREVFHLKDAMVRESGGTDELVG